MESKPDNGNTNGGTGDDDNSVKNDPTKWSLSDLKKVQEYIETAYKWTSYAKDYFSDNKLMESAQTVMAIKALKTAKEWTQSAYDYAVKKETFTYKAGDSSKTLQGELQALLSLFDGVENWTTDDHRTVQQTSLNINTSMSMFRYVISRLILEVM